jgi:hypothetical protein
MTRSDLEKTGAPQARRKHCPAKSSLSPLAGRGLG